MRLSLLKQVVTAAALSLLLSCGVSGGSIATSAAVPLIYGELDSFTGTNDSTIGVYVIDDSNGNPIANAVVKLNGVTLTYDATNQQYEGNLVVAPGDAVTLRVTVGGKTYTAAGNQFTSYPTISAPTSGTTWPINCVNTVTWSSEAATPNAFYGLGIIDAASGKIVWPSYGFLQTMSISTTSYDIPEHDLKAGDDLVIVGIAARVYFSDAAPGSEFIVSGFNSVPITVADVAPTLTSITVGPKNPAIPKGTTQQFTATGRYCDGTAQNLTSSVIWNSSDTSVATISNEASSAGKATPVSSGTTTITATSVNISGSTMLTVTEWTKQTSGATYELADVVWSGTQFVAVGNGGVILTSPDGVTWTKQASGTSTYLYAVTWSGEQFVATGSNIILTSPDGVTWTTRLSDIGYYLNDVIWSGEKFLTVGFYGRILTSPDGITWTNQTSGTMENLSGVVWSGTQFVAVGTADITLYPQILTSSDGITWTIQNTGTNDRLYDIVWSGNKFVAVGGIQYYEYASTFFTSSDAMTWTRQNFGTGRTLLGVIWSGTQFLAVGYGGTTFTSPDGTTWTLKPSGTEYALLGLASSGTKSVAVGWWGTILTYP